ncbi:TRAP transporter small permease [Marinobacterium litorale]|uniref:TRAP transporter small permease n=1 Tax=Marinobacterium litorale TaxID=404770 RepID=UPI0004182070|nr:TRAP transporter small permease subunit [Marinobacterium litorale]
MNLLPRLSTWLAGWEMRLAGVMLAAIFGLLLFNILTRAMGAAQYWVDEAAVTAMVWMTFFAASAGLHARSNIAMTLLQDAVPGKLRHLMAVLVDLVMLLFIAALLLMVWRWFDLPGLMANSWDLQQFSSHTFNFIYEEPTQTLGIRKVWVWLTLPLFSVTALLHCLAALQLSTARLLGRSETSRAYAHTGG